MMATIYTPTPAAIVEDSKAPPQDVPLAALPDQDMPALPSGFPAKLAAGFAWAGCDFKDESDYVLMLSDSEVSEIHAALEHFKSKRSLLLPSRGHAPTLTVW